MDADQVDRALATLGRVVHRAWQRGGRLGPQYYGMAIAAVIEEDRMTTLIERKADGTAVLREPVYAVIAKAIDALDHCTPEWAVKHKQRVIDLVREHLPHGSGFDNGVKCDIDESSGERLVFYTSFHHMNENGMYDGWTEHRITVRASLIHGIDLKITGRDRNEVKESIHERFAEGLTTLVEL